MGFNAQKTIIIPGLDMIVVFNASHESVQMVAPEIELLDKYVLPAILQHEGRPRRSARRCRLRGLLDQIAGAARPDAASLWKSCLAEAVDIQLKPQYIAARYPFRNAKIGFEFEQTGHCFPCLYFAS
jgi:hypothetical protein